MAIEYKTMAKDRLLFFDLLRVGSVALIILAHLSKSFGHPINILGVIGVAILIFISGAVLEYSQKRLETTDDIATFYVKRLFRIYPAFWMSFLLGLLFIPKGYDLSPVRIMVEFTGFTAWTGYWGGLINSVGWFVGLIITLYFLYPFLSASIRKYPVLMLVLIAGVEITARYAISAGMSPDLGLLPERWLPFCNFLEFGLGIWIVQRGIYPKQTYDNPALRAAADISFYVFLIHYPLLPLLGMLQAPFVVLLLEYALVVLAVSFTAMAIDNKIQKYLLTAIS